MSTNLRFLETFAVVASSGSISLAARQLDKAQPAISRQMRLLEEEVGAKLLDREHDGVRLTAAGARLMDSVGPSLRRIERAVDVVRGLSSGQTLRVGALTEAGQSLVMPGLLAFQRDWSSLKLDVQFGSEQELRHRFAVGGLDAMVVTSTDGIAEAESIVLEQERAVLVTRTQNRRQVRTVPDFAQSRFVAYRSGDPLLCAYVARHYPEVSIESLELSVVVNSHRSMLDSLLAMDAYAVMPWHSVVDHVAARVVRTASPNELSGRLYFVYRVGWGESHLGAHLLAQLAKGA